jgi:hypothetical protein
MLVSELSVGTLFTTDENCVWQLKQVRYDAMGTALCRRVLHKSGDRWLVPEDYYLEGVNAEQAVKPVSIEVNPKPLTPEAQEKLYTSWENHEQAQWRAKL